MKTLLYFICAGLMLLACRQEPLTDAGASDPLYRRWRLKGSTSDFLTFRSDGVILYGADGKDNSCCAVRFFVRRDSLLVFKDAPAKALPVALKQVDCSLVYCQSANATDPWRIVSLTDNQLILSWYKTILTYEAD